MDFKYNKASVEGLIGRMIESGGVGVLKWVVIDHRCGSVCGCQGDVCVCTSSASAVRLQPL